MSESQYRREPMNFQGTSLILVSPPDMLPKGKARRLRNVRLDEEFGAVKARPGLTIINPSSTTTAIGNNISSIIGMTDNIGPANNFTSADRSYVGVADSYAFVINGGTVVSPLPMPAGVIATDTARPANILPWRPANSPRSWAYIYGNLGMVKVGRDNSNPANWKCWLTGINPPQWEANVVNGPSFSGGVDEIYYRYRYRSLTTGAKSSPSPEPISFATTRGGDDVLISCPVSIDPQVDTIDIFRFGGAILDYRYVGSVPNLDIGGGFSSTLEDQTSDTALGDESEILEEDLWRPFITVVLPISSITATITNNDPIAGVSKIVDSGFPLYMLPGTLVIIDGKPFSLYTWNNATTTIYVRGLPTAGANRAYSIQEPTIFGNPLPYATVFNNIIIATGDKYRPGLVYWSNANDPDSTSAENFVEASTPSSPMAAPLQLGDRLYAFSADGLYALYPSFTEAVSFQAIKTSCQRGLLFNWALAIDDHGAKVYFLGRDGIYVTSGGEAECISNDLLNLFPHEGMPHIVDSNPTSSSLWLQPINFYSTNRTNLRMAFSQGRLYFSYTDLAGTAHTLIYNERIKGWESDDLYSGGFRLAAIGGSEGREIREVLYGSNNGYLYKIDDNTTTDSGAPYTANLRTQSWNFEDPGTRKLIGDVTYELLNPGNTVTVTARIDNELTLVGTDIATISADRVQRIIDCNVLGRNVGVDFSWVQQAGAADTVIYLWQPSATPKPTLEQLRWQDWHPFKTETADSYVKGIVIHCAVDGGGIKQLQIWADGAYTGNTLTFTVPAGVEQKVELSWPYFKGRLGKIVPVESPGVKWQVFSWEWIADAEPPLLDHWDTNWKPATSNNENGYVTGITIEADTLNASKNIIFQYELEGIVHNPTFLSINTYIWNGRTNQTFSFEPFRAQQLRFYSNTNGYGRLYDWKWWVSPEPPVLTNFNANWEDGGYLGAKWLQGVIIDADTQGANKIVDVETEDGLVVSITANHTRRMGRAYSLPFAKIATKFRAIPRDANPSWFYGSKWVWEPHPESVYNWETQFTSHGLEGWWHHRDGYIAYESLYPVYMLVTLDTGYRYYILLPSTAGIYRKVYVVFPPLKQKLASYKLCTTMDYPAVPLLYTAALG